MKAGADGPLSFCEKGGSTTVYRRKSVTNILPGEFRKKVLLLDIDNTLALQDDNTPFEGTIAWVKKMQEAGYSLVVVSNNGQDRVSRFAAQYSLPFVAKARKPLASGFNRARKMLGAGKKDCLVIGDQIFTDYLGARIAGLDIVLLEPIETEKKGFLRFKRKIDRWIRKVFFQEE